MQRPLALSTVQMLTHGEVTGSSSSTPFGTYVGAKSDMTGEVSRDGQADKSCYGAPMTEKTMTENLTYLGNASALPASPDSAVLEIVANPHQDTDYLIRFTAPEFTSLCPVTGQPDFAHIVVDYAPDDTIVESKSLKLFLASFRNHGAFHEDCTLMIAKRIVEAVAPKWLRIGGYWYPRGGIPIDVFWQTGTLPEGLWVPEQGVAPYRGRG